MVSTASSSRRGGGIGSSNNECMNQSNLYTANIPNKARLSGVKAVKYFNLHSSVCLGISYGESSAGLQQVEDARGAGIQRTPGRAGL